jgi:hypothetical protein
MDKVEVAEAIGKKIIQSQNDYFKSSHAEDLEHITTLKRIIVAISEYLRSEDVPADKISALSKYFRKVSKQLYIHACLKNKYQEEDVALVRKESEIWFDYIYENEEYPR